MATFRLTKAHVLYDLPSCEGWALRAWAIEHHPWGNVERESDGYIAQELEKLK